MKLSILTAALMLTATSVMAQEFPLTIEHKFGTTVIETAPERVATVDYAGADNILAFGYQPLTVRYWFGEYENGIWPWAQELLTDEPEVLKGNLNFEQIATTNPDVILAIRSGISHEEYERLSQIAPVVAAPEGMGDYELTWDERARMVGHILGKDAKAEEMIAAIENKVESVVAAHPDWSESDFAMATFWDGSIGVYSASDTSVVFISKLGLSVAPGVQAISKDGEFYITLSAERLADIDADVLFWYADPEPMESITSLGVYPLLRAPQEGREIILPTTAQMNGTLSHGTLLSLPKAIDLLVPAIEAAIDGDPDTPVIVK